MTRPHIKTLALLIAFLMCVSTLLPMLTLSEAQAQEVTLLPKTQINSEKSSFSESESFKASCISLYAASSDGFEYSILDETNKTCEITGYTGNAAALVIPSKIDGYTVTSIGYSAFYRCTGLTSVTFNGDPPATFEDNVFDDCSDDFCIYYYRAYVSSWAPYGETTWYGYPITPLNSTVGDINGDGNINSRDIAALQRHILGTAVLTDEGHAAADLNGDGNVNSRDIAALQGRILTAASPTLRNSKNL